uniref:Endonuclease/exonuclease/phosphatase domain-containing protein n=1 Tax=Podarcis muralis TaxID=64176 RepID=A0A670IUS3_PODMU
MDKDNRHIKVMTLEDEPLRSEGVQHAAGEERRTSTSRSRADEAAGPKPKGRSVADMHGSERKVQCCKEKYCIGTWNVRTMNLGKLDVVKNEMARINIDILGISELKWTGMGEFSSDDCHIYYCGQETRKRNGVALIVNKRVAKAVLGCNLKNDRMISIRIQGRPFNITVIQVYAPTTGAEETEIDQFYEDLEDLIEVTPKKDFLLIIGDWNAKVGNQEIKGTTGKFGLGDQNEAGQRLIEFCQENKLVITNTLFQQHKRRLYTWTSPDGQHRNQIDYILCSQRWRSSIQSAKTRPGADCGSDHQLLIAKFKLKLKKVGKTTGPVRYNLNQIPYEYTVEVRNRFKDLDLLDRMPEELWVETCNIIQEAATKTIPMKRKCKKAKWLSNVALQIAGERRQAKCEGDSERYRKLNADFQKNSKERQEGLLKRAMQRNRGKQQNGKNQRSVQENWRYERNMEAVRDFTFSGSMITADGDSSHKIKRRLLLGRKAMANLDSILKSRDVTLPTKVRIVKAMVFPVVMYGSESWTIKKADRRRIDAFELWCWRRLLRVPWTARRYNLSILKEISPECSLEGQIVKLRLQYFGHLMRREDSLEKTLMLAQGEGDDRGRDGWTVFSKLPA